MKVALGIVTFNRPSFFKNCAKSVHKHLDVPTFVYNDGSDSKHFARYDAAYELLPEATITHAKKNNGVAGAKNYLLLAMLATDADWLILAEDDMKVIDKDAVKGYVEACQQSGLHHLSFAHHGPANVHGEVGNDDTLVYYFHSIGSWCIYSRECLEYSGLLDPHFRNAWEHVEHSCRLARDGFTTGPYRWADARWSNNWVAEQHGSIQHSSIGQGAQHEANKRDGLMYWRDTKPDTFEMMFGVGQPLHDFAMAVIG